MNTEKTVLELSQSPVFLGFTVDPVTMELRLPPEKLKVIKADARKLQEVELVSACALAHLLGKMNATTQVIPPAPLFYRHLQMNLSAALRALAQDYEMTLSISPEGRNELIWWDMQMVRWDGRSVVIKDLDLTVDLDASILGWGVSCQSVSTGGTWSAQERTRHINCLDLMVATLALNNLHEEIDRFVSVDENRQHNSGCLHKQSRGDNIRRACPPDLRPVDVVPGEEHTHSSAIPPGLTEYSG